MQAIFEKEVNNCHRRRPLVGVLAYVAEVRLAVSVTKQLGCFKSGPVKHQLENQARNLWFRFSLVRSGQETFVSTLNFKQ